MMARQEDARRGEAGAAAKPPPVAPEAAPSLGVLRMTIDDCGGRAESGRSSGSLVDGRAPEVGRYRT